MRNIFIVLLLAFTVAFSGCIKDPKNIAPVDQVTNADYPKTLNDLETFLASGYLNLRKDGMLYGQNLLPFILGPSDHSVMVGDIGYSDRNFIAKNNINLYNGINTNLWEGLYLGVKNMNVCLERADFLEKNNPLLKPDIDDIRGQALFLRAWYYLHLECFYGEKYIDMKEPENTDVLGVPLLTAMPTSFEETRQPRSSAYKVWNQVIEDLQSSIAKLHGIQRDAANAGKATEWAAKALLGKAYVFTQQWDKAKPVLEDVINNSGKSLMSFNKYSNAFNGNPANEFNEESLWELNVERVKGTGNGISDITPTSNLTTGMGKFWGPSVLCYDGTEIDFGSARSAAGFSNYFCHDKNLRRFGFTLPPYTLVDNWRFNPGSAPTAIVPAKVIDSNYVVQSLAFRANKTADPRLYVNTLQPWVDSVTDAYGLSSSTGRRDPSGRVPVIRNIYIGINVTDPTKYHGWAFKKYQTIDNSIYTYNECDGSNIYILRLADVYLLYAEALKNLGENATALEYINKVHRRAYNQPINSPSPYDYASLTAATKAAPSDVNLINNPLAYERWAELFLEGHWWFDICRWGNNTHNDNPNFGQNEANYYSVFSMESQDPANPVETAKIKWSGYSYCFPIPGNEWDVNTAMQQQRNNPGY